MQKNISEIVFNKTMEIFKLLKEVEMGCENIPVGEFYKHQWQTLLPDTSFSTPFVLMVEAF